MLGVSLGVGKGILADQAEISVPQAPKIEITLSGDARVETADGLVDLTLTGSDLFDGTYPVDTAVLAGGPVNLVPPQLVVDSTAEVGQTLTIRPGLWAYDGKTPAPAVSYLSTGTGDITGLSYLIAPADSGTIVTVVEEAATPGGAVPQASNGISIAVSQTVQEQPTVLMQVDLAGAVAPGGTITDVPATEGLGLVAHSGSTSLVAGEAVFAEASTLKGQSLIPAGTVHPLPATPYNVTNTGIDRITGGTYAGAWLVGNDGRDTLANPGTRTQGLFILSADFTTPLANLDVGATGSVQGVAFDPSDDSFWFTDKGANAVRRCDQTGAVLQSIALSYAPNGLAYIADTDELIISADGSLTRDVYDAATGTLTGTFTGAVSDVDMLHWCSAFGLLFETYGASGAQGGAAYYPLDVTGTATRSTGNHKDLNLSATSIQAVEGLYVDVPGNRIIISDDSYTHGVGSNINAILEIDATDKLSVPLDSQTLHVAMTGSFGPHPGDTDLMVGSMGQVNSTGELSWGLFRTTGGGIRLIAGLNAAGQNFRIDWPAVTTAFSTLDFTIDLTKGTFALLLDGILQTGASYGTPVTAATWNDSFRLDDVALGGTIRLLNGATERQIGAMSVATLVIDTEVS